MHRDNYENIYVQIRGRKHFVLLPPLCQPCVNEQELVPATYIRDKSLAARSETDAGDGGGGGNLRLEVEHKADKVPFATWDPDSPDVRETKYSGLAMPMRVTLEPGDMLYLPAMWLVLAPLLSHGPVPLFSVTDIGSRSVYKVSQSITVLLSGRYLCGC